MSVFADPEEVQERRNVVVEEVGNFFSWVGSLFTSNESQTHQQQLTTSQTHQQQLTTSETLETLTTYETQYYVSCIEEALSDFDDRYNRMIEVDKEIIRNLEALRELIEKKKKEFLLKMAAVKAGQIVAQGAAIIGAHNPQGLQNPNIFLYGGAGGWFAAEQAESALMKKDREKAFEYKRIIEEQIAYHEREARELRVDVNDLRDVLKKLAADLKLGGRNISTLEEIILLLNNNWKKIPPSLKFIIPKILRKVNPKAALIFDLTVMGVTILSALIELRELAQADPLIGQIDKLISTLEDEIQELRRMM